MILLKRFKNIPLNKMITTLFLLFSIIPIVVMNIFSYKRSAEEAEARVVSQIRQTSQYVNNELNMIINEASRLMNYSTSNTFSKFLNSKTSDERYQNALAVDEVFNILREFQSRYSYIMDISIIGLDGYSFSERDGFFILEQPLNSNEEFTRVIAEPRQIHIQPDKVSFNHTQQQALTLTAAVFKMSTNEIQGIMQVTINNGFIMDILEHAKPSDSGRTMVVDHQGNDLFPLENSTPLTSEVIENILTTNTPNGFIKGKDQLVVHNQLPSADWTVISIAPNHEIYDGVYSLQRSSFIMIVISVLFIAGINFLLAKLIVQPILKLKNIMHTAASGKFNVEIPKINGQVEIMELYDSFKKLLEEIQQLLQRIMKEQDNLKKSELKALQSQINPHFLYNTLDCALWAAESNNLSQVTDIIADLSRFYRLSLSSGFDVVPFSTEINHVASYMSIMEMRYKDLLEFKIQVDPEILTASFPKIILQPIAENGIYHGIKNKRYNNRTKGVILINANKTRGNFLTITVHDNGIGMDQESLEKLKKTIFDGVLRSGQSYGLININMRLRLMFGDRYSLKISSQTEIGTTIQITVPILEEVQYEL